MTGEQFCD